MNDKLGWISQELESLKKLGYYVNIRTIESPICSNIKVDGHWVLNFCTNNYLGFANHPAIKLAAKRAIDKYGIGLSAVRTIAGTTKLHLELEERLANFKKADAVILFQSGFIANLATIPALVGKADTIFSDELNHASIIDACRLSRADVAKYKHLDASDLEDKIQKIHHTSKLKRLRRILIVSDGVFSMDGDIAPLPALVAISKKYKALLMIDDAHGEGVLGKNGRGIVDHFKMHKRVDIEVGTLSKAFGVVGGYVAGKKPIIDWLRQRARPFLFSSAATIPDVAACIAAVKILEKSEKSVIKLWQNTDYFKEKIKILGFNSGHSQTPIVPVILGDAKLAHEFSRKLFAAGIFATAIGYPTVQKDAARIRVMISASHTKADLNKALDAFEKVGREFKVIN